MSAARADVDTAVAAAHRSEWAFALAATVRITRDIDLAEECAQDAYAQALTTWAEHGIPAKPGAWLTTVARRRALNLLRRQDTARRALPMLITDARAQPGPAEHHQIRRHRLGPRPQAGLDALDQLSGDPQVATYSNLAAARADFLRRLGRTGEARDRLHPSTPAHLHHRRTTIPHITARRTRHQRGHRIPGMTSYRAPSHAHIITCSVPCNLASRCRRSSAPSRRYARIATIRSQIVHHCLSSSPADGQSRDESPN